MGANPMNKMVMNIFDLKNPMPVPITNAANPPFTTAAPINPPIKECDELTGIPNRAQKKYAQIMAPSNAAKIRYTEINSLWTISLPMVLATGTPKTNNATKLKNAAHITAFFGERIRVETIVAMEFAASFMPLTKSKVRAARIVINTMVIIND